MNTVANKLMKLVQTKSDIRQALLDKGFNVPDTMPFSGYADLIRRFPCNAKDFPDIPGMIARWSAKGLTNEDMSTNPVWKDLTGNGYDLQMKNFGWAGMSGVNGYVENFNYFRTGGIPVEQLTVDKQNSSLIKISVLVPGINNSIYIPKDRYQFGKSYYLRVSSEGYNEGDLSFLLYATAASTATSIRIPLSPNGITEIPAVQEDDYQAAYITVGGKIGSLTIEQLPLYPDAIVFDGVDDYGICENFPILTKEKGYTVVVLRQWITIPNDNLFYGLMTNGNSRTDGAFIFEDFNRDSKSSFSFGGYTTVESGTLSMPFTYQTSTSYNGKAINIGSLEKGVDIFYVGRMGSRSYYVNAAIWEICILDHDATEEELQKIQDYYKKEYPWLFPDQAWTVVGKTNEDTDRATIANITGNGNNLVLSNLGFIEGSGYNEEGEYAGYLVTDGVDDKIQSSAFTMGKDFTVVGEWVFMGVDSINYAGFIKDSSFILYNYFNYGEINVYIKSLSGYPVKSKTLKGFSSNGQVYIDFNNLKEIKYGDSVALSSMLNIGYNPNNESFTKLAFKNLAIYPTVLSKEDCIKAYNYLQTLKS